MKEKIDSLVRLTQLISDNLLKGNNLTVSLDTDIHEKPCVIFDGSDTVTYSIPGCPVTGFKVFKENNGEKYFLYDDKKDLCWHNSSKNDERVILTAPTYDQVYEFLYNYYICPLNMLSAKPSYLEIINNIYKRKK